MIVRLVLCSVQGLILYHILDAVDELHIQCGSSTGLRGHTIEPATEGPPDQILRSWFLGGLPLRVREAEDLVVLGDGGGLVGRRLLRCTSVQSSSSSFVCLGGLPRRLGGKVVVEEVVFVDDFVSESSKVVFFGLPRFLGRASE